MCHLWPAFVQKKKKRNTLNILREEGGEPLRLPPSSTFNRQRSYIAPNSLSAVAKRSRERERIPFIASPFHVFFFGSLPRSLHQPPGKDMHSPEISVILHLSPPLAQRNEKYRATINTHKRERGHLSLSLCIIFWNVFTCGTFFFFFFF